MIHGQKQSPQAIKIIIIGKVSVGKSSLLLRYVDGVVSHHPATIGIDSKIKKISYKGQQYRLELWDSAGHERYRTIVYNYFTHSEAAMVVFDITDLPSLEDAAVWMQQIMLHCGQDIPIALVANKCDLLSPEDLALTLSSIQGRIEKLKQQFQFQFFTCSAFTGINIDTAFDSLAKRVVKNGYLRVDRQTIKLNSSVQIDTFLCHSKRLCC